MAELDTGGSPEISVFDPGAPGDDGGGDSGDEGGFDRGAALERVNAQMRDARAKEEPAAEADEPVAAEPADDTKTEEQLEKERLDAKRKKLSDPEGKLSQDKLDNAFAKLTAEGRRLRSRAEEHKANVASFEAAKAQYDAAIETHAQRVQARDKEHDDFLARMKKDPLGALEKSGWTVEKLVAWIQNDGKHTPESLIEDTRSKYDTEIAELKKQQQELQEGIKKSRFESAAGEYQAKAIKTMEGLMPSYEFISKYDLKTEVAPKVLQNIAYIYREGGKVGDKTYPKGTALDPKVVLDYFEAQTAKEVSRFGVRPGQAGAASSAAKPGAGQPKTLSNADTGARGVRTEDDDDSVFDREAALRRVNQMLNG